MDTGYDPKCNLIGQPNVVVPKEYEGMVLQTTKAIYLALNNLVLTRPNWRFTVALVSGGSIRSFNIYEDGEYLGCIGMGYHGRSYKLIVENERINMKRERGRGYRTDDPQKAEMAIRKNFFRLDRAERMNQAKTNLAEVVNTEKFQKEYAKGAIVNEVMQRAREFIEAHMEMYLQEHPSRKVHYDKLKDAEAEAQVVKTIHEAISNNEGLLVVLGGSHYIVSEKGRSPTTLSKGELSFDMRKKLGLLKLVQNKQMISDIGCRVDESTFFLLPDPDQPEQPTQA